MEISKKELLELTGISYGQLYRWKREKLIPEDWFHKQSSYTGQETFFPKEKILNRIERIQQLKDQYSLEELAKMLSPEASERVFHEEDLETFTEIDVELTATLMDAFSKDEFTFVEILLMIALSQIKEEFNLNDDQIHETVENILPALSEIKNSDFDVYFYEVQDAHCFLLVKEGTVLYLDQRMKLLKRIKLIELSQTIRTKYKELFNFVMD